MKHLRPFLWIVLLGALLRPEFPRYAAERRLGVATAAFRGLLQKAIDPEAAQRIIDAGEMALSTTGPLVGDPRPWILAGSSRLVTARPDLALEYYRGAFATGERAEIDLNLGRAYSLLKRMPSAEAAYLRAGWVSPEILESLPPNLRDPLLAEIARLSEDLRQGRLAAPPPLPEDERR